MQVKFVWQNKSYIFCFIFCILTFTVVSPVLAYSCRNNITIKKAGTTKNYLTMTIDPDAGYYYPRNGTWEVSIPRQSRNITVFDSERDTLWYETNESQYLNKRLGFKNDEKVSGSEEYTFNIKYIVPRGAIIYNDWVYFNQITTLSRCEDDSETTISYPDSWILNSSSINIQNKTKGSITFEEIDSDTLELRLRAEEELTTTKNYTSGKFRINVPSLYSEYVLSLTNELNSILPVIQNKTGIKTPEGFKIVYLPLNSTNIAEETAGQYYGGKIEVQSTQLSKNKIFGLHTLIHEVIHGYSDKLTSDTPDWWWEEGVANYISHQVLSEEGKNVSYLLPDKEKVQRTFKNCKFDKEFINDWNPVLLQLSISFPCNRSDANISTNFSNSSSLEGNKVNYITDRDELGYSYSELIVKEIFSNTTAEVADVYNLMQEKDIKFSNSKSLMNNQINYFASKATKKDLTSFLQEKGIETTSWRSKKEQIDKAEQRINTLNSTYDYIDYKDFLKELESIENEFYRGNFSATNRIPIILENAEERNESAHSTLSVYRSVRDHILSLELKFNQTFYETELEKLNQSLDLLKQNRFEEARKKFEDIKEEANSKREQIRSYQGELRDLMSQIKSTNLFLSPFLLGTPNNIASSKDSFEEGKLQLAMKKLDKAEIRFKKEKRIALVFYLIIIAAISVLSYLVFIYRKR